MPIVVRIIECRINKVTPIPRITAPAPVDTHVIRCAFFNGFRNCWTKRTIFEAIATAPVGTHVIRHAFLLVFAIAGQSAPFPRRL